MNIMELLFLIPLSVTIVILTLTGLCAWLGYQVLELDKKANYWRKQALGLTEENNNRIVNKVRAPWLKNRK